MSIGGTLEKTPPASRNKTRGIEYGGGHRWTARERNVIAKIKHHLDKCEGLEVDIEELEYYLVGPDVFDVDVDCSLLTERVEKPLLLFSACILGTHGGTMG